MKNHSSLIFLITFLYSFFAENIFTQDSKLNIIVIAGQSNAMNWHSNAALLDSNTDDENIMYYFHTGIPPSFGNPIPFNSTSDNKWTFLQTQTQNPYVGLFKNFFGIEMTLARQLYSTIPKLAVIKSTYGGSNIAVDWSKGIGSGNQLYETMLSQIDTAKKKLEQQNLDYEFIGFFWMQGESDASNLNYANNYESNLTNFIKNVRSDLNTPNLKFILGRIGIYLPSPFIHKEIVRTAQLNVANNDSEVEWVNIDDLNLDTDFVHLLADGVQILGNRMADAWLSISTNIKKESLNENGKYFLMQNYPNPFNPATVIRYHLKASGLTQLKIYDLLGREVATLVNKQQMAGRYSVEFNASHLASGLYIYQLTSGSFVGTKKLLLMK
jgi:hypothetical protein